MTLHRQLFCILLLTLALPWAGCQYARELEITLRHHQIDALLEIADSASQQLSHHMPQPIQAAVAVHATNLEGPPILDGYADDWQALDAQYFKTSSAQNAQTQKEISLKAGVIGQRLFLFISIPDETTQYYNPTRTKDNGDRLYLTFFPPGASSTKLRLATSAPGAIKLKGERTLTTQIKGYWQETVRGYGIELSMPVSLLDGELQFTYADAEASSPAHLQSPAAPLGLADYEYLDAHVVDTEHFYAMPKGRVITPLSTLGETLKMYSRPKRKLYVLNANGWVLAQTDSSKNITDNERQAWPASSTFTETVPFATESFPNSSVENMPVHNTLEGLLTQFYRLILSDDGNAYGDYHPLGPQQGQFTQPFIEPLLRGKPQGLWQQPRISEAIITAAYPIFDHTNNARPIGGILIEQHTDAILSVQNQALTRLFQSSFTAIALITTALLGFAAVLSIRINRLSKAAKQVLSADGKFSEKIRPSRLSDEIGDLNRSLFTLQSRLGEYTHYLKTLASKLSHELRTPLTIVRSSLENLDMNPSLDKDAKVYIQRANEGLNRLRHIVTSMSAASRVEQSIGNAEIEAITLNDFLTNLVDSYRQSAKTHSISQNVTNKKLMINGNNELLAQMLDKLFENALEFTPEGQNIHFELDSQGGQVVITVDNDGPVLPDMMQHHLFDLLVSVRPQSQGKAHLGLGLHIVKLITEFHRGTVTATNRADHSGVVFTVCLPTCNANQAHA
jgi:dedicated sortase system histidine kinase